MRKKLLMTASTYSHIRNFHLPYLMKFKELGWEVHVACGGTYREIPYADKLIHLPFRKRYFAGTNLRACLLLRRLMQAQGYDLVITHTTLASFFTRLAEKNLRPHPRTINVVHGYLFDDGTNLVKAVILKAAEYLTSPETDMILTMNQFDTQWAKRHFPEKCVCQIPGMGVDERKLGQTEDGTISEAAKDDFVLVYPAEFSRRKNQAMLIRAMTLLPNHVKLLLPGEGVLLEACKELAKRLKVDGRVSFPGYVSIGPVLKSADAAVSASRSEGLPFNIMEAMLAGLPVIASNVKGNLDLVQDGVTGHLFPYDNEKAFSEAVKKLLDKEGARETMGENGQCAAKQFGLQRVLPAVMNAYLRDEAAHLKKRSTFHTGQS